jgi:hypothetical protein
MELSLTRIDSALRVVISVLANQIVSPEPDVYAFAGALGNTVRNLGSCAPTRIAEENRTAPEAFALLQNYPNPFNPSTRIGFSIPVGTYGHTSLRVYDVLGREVATLVNEVKQPGSYEVTFDAEGLAGGVYLYRLTSGSFTETKRLMLLR